ncbi:DUF2782 domain-containing protein [Endozoicomonas montiporae]|uniref:DUF2782 domain-containing protein n=1 Tax=Endozoicomonas montiporae CL-33 TaxID=570277 RepID=A0A142B6H3_9GAMM|nr:DUF2782 domain-containing protein [Endozoicomonas montiporae]AMO54349.1 hypothetical protein EZMO1_0076 [Endozoicomonas montiporae CL-33]
MNKQLIASLVTASLLTAGCATKAPDSEQNDLEKPPRVSSEANVISEADFNKIPKNLRPEELEQRDDTTVVIRSGDDRTIREYRIGPFLYAIHVTPKVGPPYFLVAADSEGNFIRADKPGMLVPSWTIFQWK